MNTATESVCPKGWTLPTIKQLDNNRDTTNFSPILGGDYGNGTLYDEATYGVWWGSEAYGGARRYYLRYDGSSLHTSNSTRRNGFYIRCVSEEKTVTDLTYLQDMTGEIGITVLLTFLSDFCARDFSQYRRHRARYCGDVARGRTKEKGMLRHQ